MGECQSEMREEEKKTREYATACILFRLTNMRIKRALWSLKQTNAQPEFEHAYTVTTVAKTEKEKRH